MKIKTFVSIHGGLGNQLFQLGLAHSLAEKSDVTILPWKKNCRVDQNGLMWISRYQAARDFLNPYTNFDLLAMTFARLCYKLQLYISNKCRNNLLLCLLHISVLRLPGVFGIGIITPSQVGEFDFPKLLRRNYVVAYFQSQKAADLILQSLREDNISRFPSIRKYESPNTKILVIHIRRTDYKDNPDIGMLNEKYFRSALHLMAKKFVWDELWLFSDDLDEAVQFVPKEFMSKLRCMKTDNLPPDEVLALMSRGNAYILSNSTFSWWAASMSEGSPHIVIIPEVWFKNLPEPKGLIPFDWTRVQA